MVYVSLAFVLLFLALVPVALWGVVAPRSFRKAAIKLHIPRAKKLKPSRLRIGLYLACLMVVLLFLSSWANGFGRANTSLVQAPTTPRSTPTASSTPANSKSQNSAPTSSTTSGSTSMSDQAAKQALWCTNQYSTYDYDYTTSVGKAASALSSDESSLITQALQQPANSPEPFSTLLSDVNSDISSTNIGISGTWNNYFVIYKQLPSCDSSQPNIPPLLQVPQCKATDLNGVDDCITQINPSLGISS